MKWYGLLAAGMVLVPAVMACGSTTQAGVPASGTARPAAASGVRASAAAAAEASSLLTARQPAASRTVWFDCTRHGQVEPPAYILTCADAGSVLDHMVWKSWTAQQAVATGVHKLSNCTPSCAEGTFTGYPVVTTLWRSEPVSGQPGERYFTRITVRYTGPRPAAYMSNGRLVRHPAEWTESLGPFGT